MSTRRFTYKGTTVCAVIKNRKRYLSLDDVCAVLGVRRPDGLEDDITMAGLLDIAPEGHPFITWANEVWFSHRPGRPATLEAHKSVRLDLSQEILDWVDARAKAAGTTRIAEIREILERARETFQAKHFRLNKL